MYIKIKNYTYMYVFIFKFKLLIIINKSDTVSVFFYNFIATLIFYFHNSLTSPTLPRLYGTQKDHRKNQQNTTLCANNGETAEVALYISNIFKL